MFGLEDKAYQMILRSLEEFPEIEEVLIFGSRAMGNFKPGSDVDLALKGTNISEQVLYRLNEKISGELPLPYLFDLLIYDAISNPALKEHINQFGKVFYSK